MTTTNLFNNYSVNTTYTSGDIVTYGQNIYQCILTCQGIDPLNSTYWKLLFSNFDGIGFRGNWSSNTTYSAGEYVNYGNTSYISVISNNANNTPSIANNYWTTINASLVLTNLGDIQYQGTNSLTRLPIGNTNQLLTVSSQGVPSWQTLTLNLVNYVPAGSANQVLTLSSSNSAFWSTLPTPFAEVPVNNVYYVATNGVDAVGRGNTINTPFATIKYATQHVPNNSTIYVKTGTYNESLPITVPQGVSIVGDSIRATTIQPSSNNTGTMFLLSDSTIINNLTVKGMTGFSASSNNITNATLNGVFFALNPSSPITNKSPYIKDVSTISTGGIGALADGSVHNSGYKSMLFDGVTFINDGGAGIVATNGSRAEIVSSFTYYCYFGIAASNNSIIRTMDCNNAYGTYGVSGDGANTLIRLNAHEFMSIGTGGITNTNYPGTPLLPVNANNQVIKSNNASVFYISMDENDNLSVGPQFKITTSNGSITSANSITTGNLVINYATTIHEILESSNVTPTSPGSNINFLLANTAVLYYTSNTTSNVTINFQYDGITPLNNFMNIGQSLTSALILTNGSTGYFPNVFQIDGTQITPKWAGASTPTIGDTNALDCYSFSIIKTANATYTVLGSVTKYA